MLGRKGTSIQSPYLLQKYQLTNKSQFTYRLTQTPTLSLGLFLKEPSNDRLIGHIIGNRTSSPVITDGSMLMPENWRSLPAGKPLTSGGQLIGNDPNGKTIAVHSVVMTPEFQRGGIGRALVKDYVKYIRENVDGERMALIAHDHLVGFYESAGFENLGLSEVRFAGGGWYDMVCTFSTLSWIRG